jgi:hypothetical protein
MPPPAAPLRARDVCDFVVTDVGVGRVSLHTPGWPTSFAVTFGREALPQLRRAIALLEGRQ